MESLRLLIKSTSDNTYLLIGVSKGRDIVPSEWSIPVVPNEYGALNARQVALKYIQDTLSTDAANVVWINEVAGLAKVEISNNTAFKLTRKIEEDDPDDLFEHRKFVDASTLGKYLKKHIYAEPSTEEVKPYLIAYILLLREKAAALPEDQLLDGAGDHIAADICGVLVHQCAGGIQNNGWFMHEETLNKVLSVAAKLDVDANDIDLWQELFDLSNQLTAITGLS